MFVYSRNKKIFNLNSTSKYVKKIFVCIFLLQPLTITCKKDWTVIVYIAADNDLKSFAAPNIRQMTEMGSTDNLNIIVELHIRLTDGKKVTRRYYIEKGKVYHVNADDPFSQKMDSGNPETLVACVQFATEHYPAEHYALIPWDHGTGACELAHGHVINSTRLFTFNPTINKFDLDRTINFLDFMNLHDQINRGVCWDYSTGNYISNQKLEKALKKIKETCLNNQNLDILCFDACLMSAVEVASFAKYYVDIMVSSQEVVLGTGLNYYTSLKVFQKDNVDARSFAQHIVKEYGKTYNPITNDYTMSALDLHQIGELEENINTISLLLIECLTKQKNHSVYNAIKASRDKRVCTHFDVPSYLDLHHLYKNIQANLSYFTLTNASDEKMLKEQLNEAFEEGCNLIKKIVFANVCGKNLRFAQGISIYFPDKIIDNSYPQTHFASTNEWVTFLKKYLSS